VATFVLEEIKQSNSQTDSKEETKENVNESSNNQKNDTGLSLPNVSSITVEQKSLDSLNKQKSMDDPITPISPAVALTDLDELEILKQRLDNNEKAFESFKKFIEYLSEKNKFSPLRLNIINAVQKVLATQKVANVTIHVISTLALVILFTEFAKYDPEMKPFSQLSREKNWRTPWVKEIARPRNVDPNNDKTKFSFENFFSTFQIFLPTAEEAQQLSQQTSQQTSQQEQ